MNKLFQIEVLDEQIKKLQEKKKSIVSEIINEYLEQIQYGKSKTFKNDGYKFTIKSTVTAKLDKEAIDKNYLDIGQLPIRVKYELDKKAYDYCHPDIKSKFDEFITTNETKGITYERI